MPRVTKACEFCGIEIRITNGMSSRSRTWEPVSGIKTPCTNPKGHRPTSATKLRDDQLSAYRVSKNGSKVK